MATPISTARPYTPEEDEVIRNRWRVSSVADIARRLGRHPQSVASRAGTLGLSSRCDAPEVAQSRIIAATARFEAQLLAAMARHGLKPYPGRTRQAVAA